MQPVTLSIPGSELWRTALGREALEQQVLPAYLPNCRWFGGKARGSAHFELGALVPISAADETTRLALVKAGYPDGSAETYLLPLRVIPAAEKRPDSSVDVLGHFQDGSALIEAIQDETFRAELLRLIAGQNEVRGAAGEVVVGIRGRGLAAENLPSRILKVEQSNSSVIFGDQVFLKLYRKLEEGVNPDVEITRFLSERQGFPHIPPFAGSIELRQAGRAPQVLALAQGLVPNDGDAWVFTLREAEQFYLRVRISRANPAEIAIPALLAEAAPPAAAIELIGGFATRARQLGIRTGELHRALAADSTDPIFAPEPFSAVDQRALSQTMLSSIDLMLGSLRNSGLGGDPAPRLIDLAPELRRLAEEIGARPVEVVKTRTHGDYHLGQVLETGGDFMIIDFEGEPLRPLAERREKRSPLRDVAGMLRSFHYAAHSALERTRVPLAELEPWAEIWSRVVAREFLLGWLDAAKGAPFVPRTDEEMERLLDAFLLEKAVYEVAYELNNRPAWVGIPLRGILQILASRRADRHA
jgi:maltose alpha-D-glucosyltransferase / alpha-amylase